MILVTGATGMFGSGVMRELTLRGAQVRALTHSPEKLAALGSPGVQPAVGDMDDPTSLRQAVEGVDAIFLVSPMDQHIARRETNVIVAARAAGVRRIVKLFGAVKHDGDPLSQLHEAALQALKTSGLGWTLVSPNTVMETNLLSFAPWIQAESEFWLPVGDARIGMVAADDCARSAAVVLTTEGHDGQNYELTGPEAVTFPHIAASMTRLFGRPVTFRDVSEEQFKQVMIEQAGYTEDRLEIEVLCHYRAFRKGGADLVTDTVERLTGRKPTSVDEFLEQHKSRFL